jgi:hypothetical protein
MRHHIIALGVALLLAPAVSAQTDSVTSWPLGSRVRVWRSSNRTMVGYLRELRGDTLVIVAPGAARSRTKILADSAIRLKVSEGRLPTVRNVAVGALGVAALAVVTVALLDRGAEACTVDGGCGWTPPYGGIALVGAAVGAAAGMLVLEDRWRSVRIPGRMSLVPSMQRTTVRLSFAFR